MKECFSDILQGAKQGDELAKEYILNKYEPLINSRASRFFIKNYEHEDLIQIARLTTLKAINNYDENKIGNFTAYLDRAIVNNFSAMIRSIAKTNNELSLDFKSTDDNEIHEIISCAELTEDIVEKKEIKDTIENILKGLDEDNRRIINFLYFEKNTLRQWSNTTGESYTKARRRREKILKLMRHKLNSIGITQL